MNARMLVTVVLLLLFAAFVAVNWNAIVAPTSLSLLFTTVEAPLGLVLLGAMLVLAALFVGYTAWSASVRCACSSCVLRRVSISMRPCHQAV